MADDPCAPFTFCDDLDGQVLINRTADGPAIGIELAELPFGAVSMAGASLHPYIRWTYGQRWVAKDACLGPARSVIGLAPGETVSIEVTHRTSMDVTRMVRDAADRSNVTSHTDRRPRGSSPATERSKSGKPDVDSALQKMAEMQNAVAGAQRSMSLDDGQVEMEPLHYGELGSPFLEILVGALIGAVSGGPKPATPTAAVDAVAKQLDHERSGGPGTINQDALRRIGEVVDEVQRTEHQSTISETTTTTRESTEQRITRTFANPYRDRTLELRFFPVFRRFEVTTTLIKGEPGVLLRPGLVDFAVANPRARIGDFLESGLKDRTVAATALQDPGEERRSSAMARTTSVEDHLQSNAALYTRRLVDHTEQTGSRDALLTPFAAMVGGAPSPAVAAPDPRHAAAERGSTLADGLAWSRTAVKNGEIHVPLAEPANWPEAWHTGIGQHLDRGISETIADPAWRATWTQTKTVHIFMGTHVEAVAGSCVLSDVPEA